MNNKNKPILIVDDDPIFRASLRIVLSQVADEWSLSEANSVESAINMLAMRSIDLAIVDVHLPDGTATDFIKSAGALPCLLCTQDDQEPTFKKMFDDESVSQNIVGYLIKPLQSGVIWSIRAGFQIGHERQIRNRLVAEATAELEEERRHIAQNLHDAMGALLTQLNWILTGICRAIESQQPNQSLREKIAELSTQGKQIIQEAHAEVSQAITQLRPEAVSVAGLESALKFMISQWRHAAPTVSFEYTIIPDLDSLVGSRKAGIVYRLVQEGLTNAMRHTNPVCIRLNISCHANSLRLVVESKGDAIEKKDTYPLTILRERTSTLGGVLQFTCDVNRGETRLVMTIPV